MKVILKATVALCLCLTFALPVVANAADDLTGHGFESEMRELMKRNIIKGYTDGSFKPDKTVTRAEFIVMLGKAIGATTKSKQISYSDVRPTDWHYEAIQIAANANLLNEGQYFYPDRVITREEMAVFLSRALTHQGIKAPVTTPVKFGDEAAITVSARSVVQELVALKIIAGSTNANGVLNFLPKKGTSRGETAALLNRTLRHIDANTNLTDAGSNFKSTYYNVDYQRVVDIQASRSPKIDGKGIYTASRAFTEYYLNPANVKPTSSEYLQFLVLSENADLNPAELNEKVLKGKGVLEGQAAAFIAAGERYNINEVYLIAHALHETGNGKSELAKGVKVNNVKGKNVPEKTTYNVFGIGAVDACPVGCGSQRAYEEKWFTVEDAIIGGAKFIGDKYVNAGQNTLYKMRWNPDNPGTHQYATHVMWAQLQTKKMYDIYQQLDTYTHKFDVPVFLNQSGLSALPTGEAVYAIDKRNGGVTGTVKLGVLDDSLNLRSGPTTAFSIVDKLVQDTSVTILGENGDWYKVTVNGKVGWLAAGYVALPNIFKASSVQTIEVEDEPIFDLNDN